MRVRQGESRTDVFYIYCTRKKGEKESGKGECEMVIMFSRFLLE